MKIQKRTLLVLLSLVLALSACGAKEETPVEPILPVSVDAVIAEGHILPVQNVRLNFSVRGKVAEILAEEGDKVTKNQVIIRLSDSEQAESALRGAELELVSAQQAYDDFVRTGGLATATAWQTYQNAQIQRAAAEREWEKLDTDGLQDDIDDAEGIVRDREDDLQDAQDDFDKYQDLDKDNAKRKDAEDALDAAQDDFNEAKRDLEEAIRKLDESHAALDAAISAESDAKYEYESRVEDGLAPDDKALLEARLNAAKAQVDAAQNTLDGYELKAPFAGTLTDINVEIGQLVGPELWAAQLADLSEFYVETSDLTELEVVKITENQTVEIVPDSLPELILTGSVESIGQSFKTQAGDIVYIVKINLDDTDPALRWGMTVEVTFLAE
jgi:multidrug efflux pump subunit AcrA (membrane-fusion protein)